MKNDYLIAGVDIGGSHITAGLVDMKEMKVIRSSLLRNKLDSMGAADEILAVWINTIKEVIEKSPEKISKIGFAMPGPFDYAQGVCLIKGLMKYEALYGMNIRNVLAEALSLETEDILFRNDAEAFLVGELCGGAAKGFNHAIGITLGTGLGSAISHQGIAVDAELSVALYKGEIIEEFVSSRGLIRQYKVLSGKTVKDVKELTGLCATDAHAVKAFEQFSDDLAWFLERFIKSEAPEVLVVGGNIAHSWYLYMDNVKAKLEAVVEKMPVVVKAELAEDAALIGGACCFQVQTFPAEKEKTSFIF